MNPNPVLRRGDYVTLTAEGRTVEGMIVLASSNSRSLTVMFDAMFIGYVGACPLLWDDGAYRDLVKGRAIEVKKRLSGAVN